MKQLLVFLALAISLTITSCASKKSDSRAQPLLLTGTEIIGQLARGEYDKVAGRFDQVMLSRLPPDKLEETWNSLTYQVGAYQSQDGIHYEKIQQFDVVVARCTFARAAINVRITFNDKKQISGLYFAPLADPST